MTNDEFLRNYELSAPFYINNDYTCDFLLIGVKRNSGYNIWDMNAVAMELFNCQICGECVIMFDDSREEYSKVRELMVLDMMKQQLIEKGMDLASLCF